MTLMIMVVDNDPALRLTLEVIQMDEGHDVISAEDGYQAIQFASKSPIALVSMDLHMPGIDGFDAFLKIKEILPECVVVLSTGRAVESLIDQALAQGARAVYKSL